MIALRLGLFAQALVNALVVRIRIALHDEYLGDLQSLKSKVHVEDRPTTSIRDLNVERLILSLYRAAVNARLGL